MLLRTDENRFSLENMNHPGLIYPNGFLFAEAFPPSPGPFPLVGEGENIGNFGVVGCEAARNT